METFGNPARFPSKENSFLETGTKTMKYQKIQTDGLSVALLLGFFFSFCNSDAKGGRDQSKQTENAQRATTRTSEDNARILHHKMNKIMTRSMYCKKNDKRKEKERTKETNYIYLLAHIMLRALLF